MILCVGTTPTVQRTQVFERFVVDAVNRAKATDVTASGKSINVSLVLHELGEEVVASGFVGGDSGKFIRAELNRVGITNDFVEVAPATRTCTTIIDRATGQVTELVEESNAVEEAAYAELKERVAKLLERAKVMVLSGSLTPGGPVGFYAWCVDRARQHSVEAVVDAAGEPLARAVSAGPALVKPNRAELAGFLAAPIDSAEKIKRGVALLVARGARWVVVTLGAQGSVASDGSKFWKVVTPAVEAISPIGSGDAYAAGLAAGLARGNALAECARLGAACAAANTLLPIAGQLTKTDVQRLVHQIELQEF